MQQLYLPLTGVGIPYEFEDDTFPVPRGQFSVLSELEEKNLTSAEAIVMLTFYHGSTYASGATWCFSTHYLSKLLGTGMSRTYALKTVHRLKEKGWIETIATSNPSGYRYRLQSHLCAEEDVPVNEDGKPLVFQVPRGPGGPLERCFAGDIPWKAALVWICHKYDSEWRADRDDSGQTYASPLLDLSRKVRMDLTGYQKMIKILEDAGMLQRLTPKSRAAVFQLYPKPRPRPEAAERPSRPNPERAGVIKHGEGYANEKYYYTRNFQYRCARENGRIERRTKEGWKQVSDYHYSQQMYPSIKTYFQECLDVRHEVSAESSTSQTKSHEGTRPLPSNSDFDNYQEEADANGWLLIANDFWRTGGVFGFQRRNVRSSVWSETKTPPEEVVNFFAKK